MCTLADKDPGSMVSEILLLRGHCKITEWVLVLYTSVQNHFYTDKTHKKSQKKSTVYNNGSYLSMGGDGLLWDGISLPYGYLICFL